MNELQEERERKKDETYGVLFEFINGYTQTSKTFFFHYKIFRLSPYILYHFIFFGWCCILFCYKLIGWKNQSSIIVMTLLKC